MSNPSQLQSQNSNIQKIPSTDSVKVPHVYLLHPMTNKAMSNRESEKNTRKTLSLNYPENSLSKYSRVQFQVATLEKISKVYRPSFVKNNDLLCVESRFDWKKRDVTNENSGWEDVYKNSALARLREFQNYRKFCLQAETTKILEYLKSAEKINKPKILLYRIAPKESPNKRPWSS